MKLPELATQERQSGNTYFCSVKQYPTGDMDVTSIKLTSEDTFGRGRGGVRKNVDKSTMDDATLASSRRRAAKNVRVRSLCLEADNLLTLTFRENVIDQAESWKIFRKFSRLMAWRFGDRWAYVAVQEFQERGAIHFHLAIRGYYYQGTVRRLWLRATGEYGGNIDFSGPKRMAGKNSWNPRRIGSYLAKYLTKTDIAGFNKRRYSSGGKIPEPVKVKFWISYGLSMASVLSQIILDNSRLQVKTLVTLKGFYQTIYLSTS